MISCQGMSGTSNAGSAMSIPTTSNNTVNGSSASAAAIIPTLKSSHKSNQDTTASLFSQSKDAQTMINVLKDMGIEEFEPKVINQLLELSYS